MREHSRKADWMFVKFMMLTRRKRHNRFPPDYHAIPRVALQPFHGYDDRADVLFTETSVSHSGYVEYVRNENLSLFFFPLDLSQQYPARVPF